MYEVDPNASRIRSGGFPIREIREIRGKKVFPEMGEFGILHHGEDQKILCDGG